MDWHKIIVMIEKGDLSNFSQLPHDNNKLMLFNILFAIFTSIQPLLKNELLEMNISNLDKKNENLYLFNLAQIVRDNPKFYKKNYDFSKIIKIRSAMSYHFQMLLRSKFQSTSE